MKNFLLTCSLLVTALSFAVADSGSKTAPPADPSRLYEVRIYYPTPGNYEAIIDRFRKYTCKIFEKHGMTNVGYWTPIDGSPERLIYILSYPNKEARDASWKAFGSDPEWKEVVAKTEANGKIVAKVDQIFMTEAEISPRLKLTKAPGRVFELRTYSPAPGKLNDLVARFKNHTLKLFEQHGMTNVAYWLTTQPDETGQSKLVYILAHPSEAEGKKHFDEFRADPKWVKAKADSEKNGPLTTKVESVYMKPTDYSPIQ
ncbi:NIPSNAP family protein [Larkinella terrae]|uniref:NIPSNAP family protein n=1 Tax=Larkinella terrae TaxID=2025311 RepID=A0A7K0EKV3_9BACT|nr:NIPSNAP family protein [Larkinella terrae]